MEDKCKSRLLAVSRRVEANRLEDEIWAIVYEQVWPIVRKRLDRVVCVERTATLAKRTDRSLARSA
jgi:hypothetical protein